MVAHDALLEGRALDVEDAPLWARPCRLLATRNMWARATPQDILEDLRNAVRDQFGPTIDLSGNSVMGKLTEIYAEQVGALWDLAETTLQNSALDVSLEPS